MRSSTTSRSRRAALMSSPPTTIAVRLATVGPESGTSAVSCGAISTSSTAMPSSAATNCGKDRLRPLPHLGRAGQDPDAALGGELEGGDARELHLAGAREAGAVPGEGHADPGRAPVAAGAERRTRARARSRPGAREPSSRSGSNAFELGRLGGALEHLLGGDALAQDLARRGLVAQPVQVAAADLERAEAEAPRRSARAGSRQRTRPAAPRSRGTRRSAGCSSGSRGPGSGRWGSGTGHRRGSRRDSARPASACNTPRRP